MNTGIPPIEPAVADAGSVAADAAVLAKDAKDVAGQSSQTPAAKLSADATTAADLKLSEAAIAAAKITAEATAAAANLLAESTKAAAKIQAEGLVAVAKVTAEAEAVKTAKRGEILRVMWLPFSVTILGLLLTAAPLIITAYRVGDQGVAIAAQAVKLDNVEQTGVAVHKLVNSGSLVTLKMNAELSRWKADQTKDLEHIKAADEADRLVQEHIDKQRRADAEESRVR